MKTPYTQTLLALVLFSATHAHATLLLNGSFEDSTNNWNPSGNLAVRTDQGVTDGANALAFSFNNLPSNGEIWQSFATDSGEAYLLSYDFGKFSVNQPGVAARLTVNLYDGAGFSGTVLLNETNEDTTNTNSNFYNPFQYNFTAQGSTTTLRFRDFSDPQISGGGFDAMLDKVDVSIVPEPATSGLLLAVGALALAATRRRKGDRLEYPDHEPPMKKYMLPNPKKNPRTGCMLVSAKGSNVEYKYLRLFIPREFSNQIGYTGGVTHIQTSGNPGISGSCLDAKHFCYPCFPGRTF